MKCLFHCYDLVGRTGAWEYRQCRRCGSRIALNLGPHGPRDEGWLQGNYEWGEAPERELIPPRGGSAVR